MSEFGTRLTTLLDDVAASIEPKPDFGGVANGNVPLAAGTSGGGGGLPFRRAVAVAAASALVLGGVAAAAYQSDDAEPDLVATASTVTEPTVEPPATTTIAVAEGSPNERPAPLPVERPKDEQPNDERQKDGAPKDDPAETTAAPAIEYSAELGVRATDGDVIEQAIEGTAGPGERVVADSKYGEAATEAGATGAWRLVLRLDDVPYGSAVGIRVGFTDTEKVFEFEIDGPPTPATTVAPKPEPEPEPKPEPEPEPKPEPEPEPEPVDFTARLGNGQPSANPMKQVLYGTATPGSKILATSAYGHATATAGPKGGWELVLKMYEVPAPSGVRITVSIDGGSPEFEFWVERPAPEPEPEPEPVEFTAQVANTYHDGELTKVVLYGTANPGSGVLASSEHGAEDARVGDKGNWELHLKLWDIPAGHEALVRVTNNQSEAAYEFVVDGPEPEPEPEPVEFTANAALTESDRTPPVNEYWGTITPGAKVKVDSEFGSTYIYANDDGVWDARLEFPEAPIGETFTVVVWSPEAEAEFAFPFTRLPAV